ncbi:hypothetical protein NPIL_328281 [Nephila pilipes]|uniref:Uncharacterized protein n=1 Tax=Nephila pilipes TaxID=299642 RepID=A0A8X6TMH1_NEPPI|nr:hypothetical protein NPIL_328281 [Nephila pilipes]
MTKEFPPYPASYQGYTFFFVLTGHLPVLSPPVDDQPILLQDKRAIGIWSIYVKNGVSQMQIFEAPAFATDFVHTLLVSVETVRDLNQLKREHPCVVLCYKL